VNRDQQNNGWAELKGQAKRQIQDPVNEVAEFTAIKQIKRKRESLKPIRPVKLELKGNF